MYFECFLDSFSNIVRGGAPIEMDGDGILSCINVNHWGRVREKCLVSCKISHPESGRHDN